MKLTAVLFSLCVTSGVAFDCPDYSTEVYSPAQYFGDCQCDDGYTKNAYVCLAVPTPAPTPPSPTREPTQGQSPTPAPVLTTGSCVGAGPWANSPNMGVWCNNNCNSPYPYCPASHCSCGGRRLSTQRKLKASPKPVPNGEKACENREFDETQCSEIGCCEFDEGQCFSAVDDRECTGYMPPPLPPPTATPSPTPSPTPTPIAQVPELPDAVDCDPRDCYDDDTCSCWQFFKRMANHEVKYNGQFFSWKQWRGTGCNEDPRPETCTGKKMWSGTAKAITKDDFVEACASNNAANVRLGTCNAAFYRMAKEVSEDMQHVSEADSWTEAISFADFATNWNNLKAGDSVFSEPLTCTLFEEGVCVRYNSGVSTSSSSGGSTGVSVGVVAMCVVAAVGAGVGVGYFAKGRENTAGADARQEDYLEMQARLSDDGSSL